VLHVYFVITSDTSELFIAQRLPYEPPDDTLSMVHFAHIT